MQILSEITGFNADMAEIRHDLHAHPELGFNEFRTSDIVAAKLESWGVEVHRGFAGTGIVGVISGRRKGDRRIAIRADMDALPINETSGVPYASVVPDVSHACGHDAHTTMLLGAARYLARTRNFAGTAILVFQPAEEGLGGARAMLRDGIMEKFRFQEIYGLHVAPLLPGGKILVFPGPLMAGADTFEIRISGKGSHAARPEHSRDPVMAAAVLAQSLQTIVSRNIEPKAPAVLSVTQIHAGSANNVIPGSATLSGTIRAFSEVIREQIRERVREIANGTAVAFGVSIEVVINDVFRVLENHPEQTVALTEVARSLVGNGGVITQPNPVMSSEDFADFLRQVPGAYCWLGHGGGVPVHNSAFVFDDEYLPLGASLLAGIVEARCGAT